jgi:malonyl CoA-acyl carrier protein transacylase
MEKINTNGKDYRLFLDEKFRHIENVINTEFRNIKRDLRDMRETTQSDRSRNRKQFDRIESDLTSLSNDFAAFKENGVNEKIAAVISTSRTKDLAEMKRYFRYLAVGIVVGSIIWVKGSIEVIIDVLKSIIGVI